MTRADKGRDGTHQQPHASRRLLPSFFDRRVASDALHIHHTHHPWQRAEQPFGMVGVRLAALVAVLVSAAAVCCAATADNSSDPSASDPPGVGIKVSFRPSVAIVVGIFTMIFSLTFLLLMYAKFCHPSSSASSPLPATAAVAPQQQQGVAKPVIESLPFFRFATLRGARQGMDCAVCLAPFEDTDHLRLLPRCRHAFHLGCVDRWLESNASCPLCRAPVDADDDARLGLKYAASARIVFGGGDDQDDDAAGSGGRDLLDIYVERVPSSRFPPAHHQHHQVEEEEEHQLDRHRHRIIVSDVVFKSRWSELVNSADLIALDAEMLCSVSSFPSPDQAKLSSAQEEDRKRLLAGGSSNVGRASFSSSEIVRSVSEIVSLPRLHAPARERLAEEENRRWLPIARRTARWFAAGRPKQDDDEGGVHVEAAHV
jgi:E3 ubiquitin-protein ligase ATL6/9/15/31/42/55